LREYNSMIFKLNLTLDLSLKVDMRLQIGLAH
jgi:hypothetical protein